MSSTTTQVLKNIRDYGFEKHKDRSWTYLFSANLCQIENFAEWIRTKTTDLDSNITERSNLFTHSESPNANSQWFIKQYHRGGLLSSQGDVYYSKPDRFLNELLASLKARENHIPTPEPIGVAWNESAEGFKGFYVSKYIDGARISQLLRNNPSQEYFYEMGKLLAKLHESGIDHQDYKLDNIIVSDGQLYITDFDPVSFGSVSRRKRSARLHRFRRFTNKYGFRSVPLDYFMDGYTENSSVDPSLGYYLQAPVFWTKNRISDLTYQLTGREIKPVDLEKVLVRAPNWLGDTVMSLPFLQSLAAHKNVQQVDVVCRQSVSDTYELHESITRVHTISEGKQWSLPNSITGERYSTIFIIPKSLRTGLQAWLSNIPRRVGFSTQGRQLFLTDRVALNGKDRSVHHARLFYSLAADFLDVPEQIPDPELQCGSENANSVREQFNLPDSYLTIHPGSAYGPAKRWTPDQFNDCLRNLISKTDYKIVSLGVPDETGIAEAVLRNLPEESVINLVGDTNLKECLHILQNSAGTIANDSGIMHLSAALKTPTVGIFGSSSPDLTAPIGPSTKIIYENVECSPCFERECPRTDERYKCLERINPEAVTESFLKLLAKNQLC